MASTIFIHKEAGQRKDAVRVRSYNDIPEFLKSAISVTTEGIELDCVEGREVAPFGAVIGYEKSEKTSSGWNCWVIGNADTNLIEKNGVFYKKATIMKAQAVSETVPDFLQGARTRKNADGSWSIQTDWGVSTGYPEEAYWVLYGTKEDGSLDANILTKTEKSYGEYIVCTSDGQDIGRLAEIDPA